MRTKSTPSIPRVLTAEEEAMKSLPLDEYVQWMLDHGRYDACLETGRVRNVRFDRWLVSDRPSRRGGYCFVTLVFNKRVKRPASVHRIVAIKAWGADRIRGKEVGHKNGIRTECRLGNLWVPETRREHQAFDNSTRGLKRGPKESWEPCVRCGDEDGAMRFDLRTPERISGQRFGIDGSICRRCYDRLKYQEKSRHVAND